MVCPRDGDGHSWTLHRNYLLPISDNLKQAANELIDQLPPVPPADNGLLANGPNESQPGSPPGSAIKQSDPVNLKLTELTTSDTISNNS